MEGRNEMGKKMGKDDKDLNGLKCHTRKKLTLNFSKWLQQARKKSGQNAILQGQEEKTGNFILRQGKIYVFERSRGKVKLHVRCM